MSDGAGVARRTAMATVMASGAATGVALAAEAQETRKGETMAKFRAYEVGERSRAQGLRLVEREAPAPGHGEAVVRIRATGLNARDLSIMFANAPTAAIPPTRVPLMDNAGDVLAVGPGVTRVKPGERVTMTHYWRWLDGGWDQSMTQEDYSLNRDGFLAEQALVPADALVKIPDGITYEEASTLQSAGLTAWNAVVEAGRAKASDVVVTLGTGGVSVFGLQWAKMLGARAIITSSSDEKLKRMTALGADDVINYRAVPNWSQAVLDKTGGRGADIVLNTVGIGEMEQCLLACASGGRVMYIGANPVNRDRTVTQQPGLNRLPNLIIKDLTIKGIVVGSRRMYEDLLAAMAQNKIKPVIDRVFAFEQVMDAVAYMESGEKVGKIVIKVD